MARLKEVDEDDSQEIADRLRFVLSAWLTVPVLFDNEVLDTVMALGESEAVETRWGREIRASYDLACSAATAIQRIENPARIQVRETIRHLRVSGLTWRIYCHRSASTHFATIFQEEPLAADSFLYSVKDYREAKPFDALVKVGPLRSRGWGSVPDAILNAPRFEKLVQIVWAGCADEDDFGYDPLRALGAPAAQAADQRGISRASSWTRSVVQVGDSSFDSTASGPDLDELRFFYELARASEMRRAALVQIDDDDGILFLPHSQVATFDPSPNAEEPIGYKLPAETLTEGMFLIWPILGAADLGVLQAGEGHYSRIWKERLRNQFRHTPSELLRDLRAAGIDLRNLRSCVRQWCRPPSTVIHAPQQKHHFERLIRVLGIDHSVSEGSRALSRPWWEYAWGEIGHARGEAIQSGMQEHNIIDEQLFVILNDLLPDIQNHASSENVFQIEIPANRPLQGAVRFYPVRSVEEGFLVPDTILKTIYDLDSIEQWRA